MMAAFNYKGTDGSLWFHIGANVGQGINLSIEAVNVAKLHEMAAKHTKTEEGFNIEELRTSDVTEANSEKGVMRVRGEDINKFVAALDASLAHVVGQRAHLGAVQNRLEYTIENLDIASENLSASNSRIKDADMAKEMMRFTQFNVLQQAAISMLAQANQAPQNILQLLR
jgi:flagellin